MRFIFLFCLLNLTAYADERADIIKSIEMRYAAAEKAFYECDGTQVELTAAAGHYWNIAEKLFVEAAEWKIRQAKNAEERRVVLDMVYQLGREVEEINSAPRDEMCGSGESMRRNADIASRLMRQSRIFLLSDTDHQRWKRICNTTGSIAGKTIILQNGLADFPDQPYGEPVVLRLEIKPEFCFSYRNKDYAIVMIDLPKSVNSDYLKLYLCRFESGKLLPLQTLDVFYLNKIQCQGDFLQLFGQKTHQQGVYVNKVKLKELK